MFFLVTLLTALVVGASGVHAGETILEDTPERLVLEVKVPSYGTTVFPEGIRGTGVSAPGYGGPGTPGAPELPWLRFQIAAGARAPRVSVEPLEWTSMSVPGGLAAAPRWLTKTDAEPVRDEALFAAARGIQPSLSPVQPVRGLPVRTVSVPLGTYTGGERVNMMRTFRVRVDFAEPSSMAAPGLRKWLRHAGVRNLNGGAYHVTLPRSAPLARTAAVAGTKAFDSEALRLQITIGDRVLDGFDEDGVYALTFAQASAAVGSPLNGVDINRLRMYSGPQDTLRIRMDTLVGPTLREIPLEVRDANNNGVFDAGDTILFYAHGTSLWKPVPGAPGDVRWQFSSDPWSYENRYYLQWNGPATGALRIPTAAAGATGDTVTTAPHYLRAERELATGSCDLAQAFDPETGHNWYWHGRFYCNNIGTGGPAYTGSQLRAQSWTTLDGRVSDSAWVGFFHLFTPIDQAIYRVWSANAEVAQGAQGVPGGWYLFAGSGHFASNQLQIDSLMWDFSVVPRFEGYTVRYTRNLSWSNGRRIFPAMTGQRVAYKLSGAPAGARVLRVESGVGARWLPVQVVGSALAFSDSAGVNEDVSYHLQGAVYRGVEPSALSVESPVAADGVIRNLADGSMGGGRENPEYIIIAPQALLPEAVRLRNYRGSQDRQRPWNTVVVRVEDIYREWSGGRMSPVAIRDFLRWAMNRWGTGGTPGELTQVVLFGDGHFDYRNIRNGLGGGASPNHIPPFNWQESESSPNPMSTDDFYAILDAGAHWTSSLQSISIGRISAKTREQANNYLDKVIRYEDPATSGEWRSRLLLTADDATQRRASGGVDRIKHHTYQAERIGNAILAQDSGLRKETVYLFDYEHNASYLKPEATQDLLNQYNRGVLFSTFYGHGAYNQMADEVLLKTNDGLTRLRNAEKPFMMTIFSCTVGRFDKLVDEGMSEEFLRMNNAGAIAALSGTRETYDGPNEALGFNFVSRLFAGEDEADIVTVGDAVRMAKATTGSGNQSNSQKYVLQGEPVLYFKRPGLGLELTEQPDSLQALGCGTLSGRVGKGSGKGAVSVRIVSGDVRKAYPYSDSTSPQSKPNIVDKRGQILFETTVPYTDSVFSLQYFLPKQVPFGDTGAKIQIFAWDSLDLRESSLLVRDLKISGTAANSCMVDDQRGPRITVTGCNTAEAGGVDFPDKVRIGLPYCFQVAVSDSGGGVLAGDGPDQGTTVEVVGSVAPYQPQAGVDELYRKVYQVPLSPQEVPEGTHLLKISARDGFGNLSQRQLTLQVSADTALRFVRAFNTPNPLKNGKTTFWFSTSLPVEEGGDLTSPNVERVRFDLRIFNQLGYMVREFRDARSGETQWDGRDAWGRQLANGVYFYEVSATWSEGNGSPAGGRRTSRKNVLVISR